MVSGPVEAEEFAAWMARLGPFESVPVLGVGVSGGADSLALAVLADGWSRARGGSLLGLIVDHGLRPNSAGEAVLVAGWLREWGIEARILTLDGLNPGPSLAARARAHRRSALEQACRARGVLHLLLGHHAGDQAETMLMRELAGSGPVGLAAMPALVETADVRLLRPLLDAAPGRLRATLVRLGMDWVRDPSNSDPRALRSRVRAARGDAEGDGAATRALIQTTHLLGRRRAGAEGIAAVEGVSAVLRPEGFALLPPGGVPEAVLASLVQTIAGAPFPPPEAAIARLAHRPGPATLGGVRVLPAGRLGPGWLVVREEAAVAPPILAVPGAVWDGRFRLSDHARPGEGATIGALADDAANFRRARGLPAVVLRTLPAIRLGGLVLCVPALSGTHRTADALMMDFMPPKPAFPAAFVGIGDAQV